MRTLLNGVNVTGAGEQVRLPHAVKNHTVVAYFVDADVSVTAVTVILEGSLDPNDIPDAQANWFPLAEHVFTSSELTAKKAAFHVDGKSFSRIRGNLSVFTGKDANDLFYMQYEGEGLGEI